MFLMTTLQEEIYRLEKGIESDQKLKVECCYNFFEKLNRVRSKAEGDRCCYKEAATHSDNRND